MWITQEELPWNKFDKFQKTRKNVLVNLFTKSEASPVVPVEWFSSLSRLVNVTSMVFKFINKL